METTKTTRVMNNGTIIGYKCNDVFISKRIGPRLPWTYVLNGDRQYSSTLQMAKMHILRATKNS